MNFIKKYKKKIVSRKRRQYKIKIISNMLSSLNILEEQKQMYKGSMLLLDNKGLISLEKKINNFKKELGEQYTVTSKDNSIKNNLNRVIRRDLILKTRQTNFLSLLTDKTL